MPLTASGVINGKVGGTLTITLPGESVIDFSRCLQSVDLSASMTTPLPDQVRAPSGVEAVTGDITITGDITLGDGSKIGVFDLLNPDNLESPLAHLTLNDCAVTFDFGPANDKARKLTGWVNGYDPDPASKTVVLHVVDLDPDWDTDVELPPVVTVAPFNAGLTPEYGMDRLIRYVKGASTWPAPRANVLLAIGERSSLWPEVGTLNTATALQAVGYVPGVHGSAMVLVGDTIGLPVAPTYTMASPVANTVRIEGRFTVTKDVAHFTVFSEVFVGDPALVDGFSIDFGPHGVTYSTGDLVGDLDNPTGPVYNGSYYAEVVITLPSAGGTTWKFEAKFDGVTVVSSGSLTRSTARPSTVWQTAVTGPGDTALEEIQLSAETITAPSNFGFVPIAVLDPSPWPMIVVPGIAANTGAWAELQQMAAAYGGYIRRDPDGLIRFTNRYNLLGQTPTVKITSRESLKTLGMSVPASNAIRKISVPYTDYTVATAPELIWQSSTKWTVPAGQTRTWVKTLPDGALVGQVDGTINILPDGHDPTDGSSWMRASNDPDGDSDHPAISGTVRALSGNTIAITLDNTRGRHKAWMVSSDAYSETDLLGQPAVWIGGIPVTASDEASVPVVYRDGRNPQTLDSNAYRQDYDAAQDFGWYLIGQSCVDVRDYTGVSIVPNKDVDCGLIVALYDAKTASKVNEYAMVWGWTFEADFPPPGETGGTWDMTIDPRPLAPAGAWLGGAIPDRANPETSWAYS